MTRCPNCDLELDEFERFCPGCGEEAPHRVVEVLTTLRESFHGASSDDEDTEYAFGSKRAVKTAAPRPSASRTHPSAAAKRPSAGREPVAEAEAEPERVAQAEVVADEPDVAEIQVADEPEVPVPDEEPVPQAGEAPVEGDGAPARVVVVPGAEGDSRAAGPVTPYVVLPVRRAVAVREPEPLVEDAPDEAGAPRRSRWKRVLLLVVVVAVAGAAAYTYAGRERGPVGQPFTAEAQDGAISLDAPAGWRVESRAPGVLGIGEPAHDLHVHATAIRRSALADGLSLKRRADEVQAEFLASLEDVDASAPLTTKIGPYPAIRQVLSTSSVIYVHTVVKMPKYFVNVLAWTSAERFNDEQEKLLDVAATLQSSS